MNKVDFAKRILVLGEIYDKQITKTLTDVYYEIFKDYSTETFSRALEKCLRTRAYSSLPKPAEILEFLEGTPQDKALIAWLQVKEAIGKGGYYASIEFADPVIAHCVNWLGGWTWLCCSQIDEMPFIEKRFLDMYRLLAKRETLPENVRLVGFIEAQNNQAGYSGDIPKPIRIGFGEGQLTKTNQGEAGR